MSDDRVFAKCAWRLIPFMMLLLVVSSVDRLNVGFAALTMNKDLSFAPSVFGFGAGVFFVSYALVQVPANLMLNRMGARRWVFCIMAIWGTVSAGCAFVRTPLSFYVLRFLLGLAEAGLFPGMVFYLTLWFPKEYRARFTASFAAAIPISFVIGGPVSGLILEMDGIAELHGWQWLFLLEGLPAVLLSIAVLTVLPDGPGHPRWLSADEKKKISASLSTDRAKESASFCFALRDPRLLVLGLVGFGFAMGMIGVEIWLPQILQAMGFSNLETGFLVAILFAVAIPAMVLWGRRSDASGERIWHVALPALLAAFGFVVASLARDDWTALAGFTCVSLGVFAWYGPFYSLPSSFLDGPAAASGIALVNSISVIGGFLGPFVIGVLKERTGGYGTAMAVLAIMLLISSLIILALGRAMAPRAVLPVPRPGSAA